MDRANQVRHGQHTKPGVTIPRARDEPNFYFLLQRSEFVPAMQNKTMRFEVVDEEEWQARLNELLSAN
jgi:hypothetical protein